MWFWPFGEKYRVEILDSGFEKQIVDLRKRVFKEKYGKSVDVSGLEFNRADASGTHLGVFSKDQLVSILRLGYVERAIDFQHLMQFSPDHAFSVIPCYCLARAATDLHQKEKSLNMALRLKAMELVLENPKEAQFLYGTALAQSQRLNALKDLGYEILIHNDPWKGYLNSENQPIAIFRLSIAKLPKAIEKLKKQIKRRRFENL